MSSFIPTLRDRFGNTALHLAVEAGSLKTVRTILNVEGHLINEINKAGVSL